MPEMFFSWKKIATPQTLQKWSTKDSCPDRPIAYFPFPVILNPAGIAVLPQDGGRYRATHNNTPPGRSWGGQLFLLPGGMDFSKPGRPRALF